MNTAQIRYAVTSAFGSIAISTAVVAYPAYSIGIILLGALVVGLLCGAVAAGD